MAALPGPWLLPFANTEDAFGGIDTRCFLLPKERKRDHSPSKRTSSKSSKVS